MGPPEYKHRPLRWVAGPPKTSPVTSSQWIARETLFWQGSRNTVRREKTAPRHIISRVPYIKVFGPIQNCRVICFVWTFFQAYEPLSFLIPRKVRLKINPIITIRSTLKQLCPRDGTNNPVGNQSRCRLKLLNRPDRLSPTNAIDWTRIVT